MVAIINKEQSSKAVHKLKSFYTVILNKVTELSTLTMHHSTKKTKQDITEKNKLENMVSLLCFLLQ